MHSPMLLPRTKNGMTKRTNAESAKTKKNKGQY